ncbi:NifB/NifX family molybdenum-iron cluster-binding protein [candidate division KSB1 bacterium]
MKIAIPTDDWETISTQILNNKGFAIFEIEGSQIKSQEFRSNKFTTNLNELTNASHKSDRYDINLDILKDCDVVILCESEERLITDLSKKGIEIVLTNETYLENALNSFLRKNCEIL